MRWAQLPLLAPIEEFMKNGEDAISLIGFFAHCMVKTRNVHVIDFRYFSLAKSLRNIQPDNTAILPSRNWFEFAVDMFSQKVVEGVTEKRFVALLIAFFRWIPASGDEPEKILCLLARLISGQDPMLAKRQASGPSSRSANTILNEVNPFASRRDFDAKSLHGLIPKVGILRFGRHVLD